MGNGGDVWVARIGLAFLGLTSVGGAIGCTILALNHDEIPPFLASLCGGAAQTLGLVVLALYGRGNGETYNIGRNAGANVPVIPTVPAGGHLS